MKKGICILSLMIMIMISPVSAEMFLHENGNVGIGTDTPAAKLDVLTDSGDTAVVGESTNGVGVYGISSTGYAGYFDGEVMSIVNRQEYYMVPKGAIIMWSGLSVPDGWVLCDGTLGTPDLRDRFVIGAGGSYTIGNLGGTQTHTHGAGTYTTLAHTHTYSGSTDGAPDQGNTSGGTLSPVSVPGHDHSYSGTTDSGGSGLLTGNSSSTDSLPPYYALAYIMKI